MPFSILTESEHTRQREKKQDDMGRKGYRERERKDNEKKSTLRKYIKKNVKSRREKGMQKEKTGQLERGREGNLKKMYLTNNKKTAIVKIFNGGLKCMDVIALIIKY